MAVPPTSPADDDEALPGQGSRGGMTVLCAVALLVLAMSLLGGHDTSADSSRPPVTRQATVSAPALDDPAAGLPRAKPTRLLIPEISVDAPFTDLAVDANGRLQPPPADDTNLVGWYAKGTSPGEKGTAIVAGHVDTKTSAAVFVRLDQLRAGDVFHIERADGRTASFTVDDVETFAKDAFPSDRVYDDADRPEVRLITCAGVYDRKAKDYTDNLVVFAHLT